MSQTKQHPMIPVPEAIRMILWVTAGMLLEDQEESKRSMTLSLKTMAPYYTKLLGYVVAETDILMPAPGYPNYRASIMDGYAIHVPPTTLTTSTKDNSTLSYRIVDKVLAGDDISVTKLGTSSLQTKEKLSAVYITTGAMVPDEYNCVVPIEECQVSDDGEQLTISSTATLKDQQWIRPVGSDIPPGTVVLPKGHVLDPIALGLLLQAGVDIVTVQRPLQVGVLSTGNELIVDSSASGADDTLGKIPDVNRPILSSLLNTYNRTKKMVEPIDFGMVRDDSLEDITKKLQDSLRRCDILLTTGGVSMGETDLIEQVLVDHCGGTIQIGRLHMKPGKPTKLVTVPWEGKSKLVFALPGNPVSATVCTQLLVKPCLDLYFTGIPEELLPNHDVSKSKSMKQIINQSFVHPEIKAVLAHDISLDKVRPEYHRVVIQKENDNTTEYTVVSTGIQQSSRLMSLRDAEGLLVLPKAQGTKVKAQKGERYIVLLLDGALGKESLRLEHSLHFQPLRQEQETRHQMKIAVIELLPSSMTQLSKLDETCEKVQKSLSGSHSGDSVVVSKTLFDDNDPATTIFPFLLNDICGTTDVDFVVISCPTFHGSFPKHLEVSTTLKSKLSKVADSLSLQARQGAAAQDSKAALFEVVVGFLPLPPSQKGGAMVICLPESGVSMALSHVRGLLKHSLNLARGKAHNHHHQTTQHKYFTGNTT